MDTNKKSNIKNKSIELARFEIEWWKAHHRRDKEGLIESMTRLYSLQFGISIEEAKTAVLLRVEATSWHDEAEKYEDSGDQNQADIYWDKAQECLKEHFLLLEKKSNKSK